MSTWTKFFTFFICYQYSFFLLENANDLSSDNLGLYGVGLAGYSLTSQLLVLFWKEYLSDVTVTLAFCMPFYICGLF